MKTKCICLELEKRGEKKIKEEARKNKCKKEKKNLNK